MAKVDFQIAKFCENATMMNERRPVSIAQNEHFCKYDQMGVENGSLHCFANRAPMRLVQATALVMPKKQQKTIRV